VRLYWEIARRGYRRYSAYPGATLAGIFTNTVFGFMLAYILLAVFRERDEVGAYDASDAVTYVWLSQGLLMTIYIWGWYEVALRVQSGDVATDLQRPLDFQRYWLAQDLGRALYHATFRGVPPFLVGMLAFDVRLPGEPLLWVSFPLSVALAVVVSFAWRFLGRSPGRCRSRRWCRPRWRSSSDTPAASSSPACWRCRRSGRRCCSSPDGPSTPPERESW